jgi:hypothetical protein
MSNLAPLAATVPATAKLRLAIAAAAISCLGATAFATAPEASAGPIDGHLSYAKRVHLRKQGHKRQTRTVSQPVSSSPAPTPTPSQPAVPTPPSQPAIPAPTQPTAPTLPATPTSPTTPPTPSVPTSPTAPSTPTAPAPAPTPAPAGSLFSGLKLRDFAVVQSAPNAITEVADPLGSGEKVLKMTVSDKDVAPITPTENPRAQALSPDIIEPGDEFWLSTKFLLPSDFPSNVPGWLGLGSIYGPPFNGPSPWQLDVEGGSICWPRNANYKWDVPWQMPIAKGRWITVLLHERFATDGWVEMWVDGQPIRFFTSGGYNPSKVAPTEHLAMKTMDQSNNGGANAAKIANYREVGMFSSVTVYFGALRVGGTRASVGG